MILSFYVVLCLYWVFDGCNRCRYCRERALQVGSSANMFSSFIEHAGPLAACKVLRELDGGEWLYCHFQCGKREFGRSLYRSQSRDIILKKLLSSKVLTDSYFIASTSLYDDRCTCYHRKANMSSSIKVASTISAERNELFHDHVGIFGNVIGWHAMCSRF